jgi:hypothetical protein
MTAHGHNLMAACSPERRRVSRRNGGSGKVSTDEREPPDAEPWPRLSFLDEREVLVGDDDVPIRVDGDTYWLESTSAARSSPRTAVEPIALRSHLYVELPIFAADVRVSGPTRRLSAATATIHYADDRGRELRHAFDEWRVYLRLPESTPGRTWKRTPMIRRSWRVLVSLVREGTFAYLESCGVTQEASPYLEFGAPKDEVFKAARFGEAQRSARELVRSLYAHGVVPDRGVLAVRDEPRHIDTTSVAGLLDLVSAAQDASGLGRGRTAHVAETLGLTSKAVLRNIKIATDLGIANLDGTFSEHGRMLERLRTTTGTWNADPDVSVRMNRSTLGRKYR